ncbi:MAG: FAD-dependent oxidoreductase [Actinomycetia bacterium]|nr:FAD-dependent oxidoreductase [Actinomycetes bacterium]
MPKGISRRNFLKGGLAASALGAASLGLASCTTDGTAEGAKDAFELGIEWDNEYDVIVVGGGGAGLSCCIAAADAGAKVLLLEKAPEGEMGGSSNICMQWVCYTEDKAKTMTYFQTMRGDYETPSDEMLSVFIDGMMKNKEWLQYLGAPNVQTFEYTEFPQFPGSDAFTPITTNGNTGINRPRNFGGDGATYNLLRDACRARTDKIDMWFEAPATRLIQEPATKIIHGVECTIADKTYKIRAKNGVCLACGGFENNPAMQQDYIERVFSPSLGRALYNTGDGIKMALEINADLWHMGNVVTNNGEFFDWDTMTATFGFMSAAGGTSMTVGNDGTRVYDGTAAHGKVWNHGNYTNAVLPDKMYKVFDQKLMNGITYRLHSQWTQDLAVEFGKGWIKKANTLEELGKQLGFTDDACKKLATQVDFFNSFAGAGPDPVYGRSIKDKIDTPPFYAIQVTQCLTNTQGGPRKNEKGEILDVDGNPIPHLYESGELGDIHSNLYQASNNLGGGLIFGRISGGNAAAAKTDNYQGSVMDGKTRFVPEVVEPVFETAANQYIGKGRGKGQAPLVVRLTLDNNKISKVEVLQHFETTGLTVVAQALDEMPKAMVAKNSANVDITAGATRTAGGLISAAQDALKQANIPDPTSFNPGTYTGSGSGMHGTITVTITVNASSIVSVDSITDPGETPGIGGKEAIADGTFARQIMTAQSSKIDGVTGATITSSGVAAAVHDALSQAAK